MLLAGAAAGVTAYFVTYPLDVVKSVIQTLPEGARGGEFGMFRVARGIYRERGAGGFFRGLAPTLLRGAIVDGVIFLVYEGAMDALHEPRESYI